MWVLKINIFLVSVILFLWRDVSKYEIFTRRTHIGKHEGVCYRDSKDRETGRGKIKRERQEEKERQEIEKGMARKKERNREEKRKRDEVRERTIEEAC